MLLMFEVLVALASASWLVGEEIGVNKVIGGALIIAASIVDAWGSVRSDRRSASLRAVEAE
jgi:drug/metabolite transporter (DMT)-like permease